MSTRKKRTFRGHRADSFVAIDMPELQELRARQRTFSGAYSRTALGSLGYALTILRLFDRRYHTIGLLFAILAALIFILAFFRGRHSLHDFSDQDEDSPEYLDVLQTVGQEDERVFGKPFHTAGWLILALTVMAGSMEIALMVLVFHV